MPGLVNIERHIVEQERKNPGATGELSDLLYQIAQYYFFIVHNTNLTKK